MKYLKTFESRYKPENIDKKYYVWSKYSRYSTIISVIEIVSVIKGKITYKIIKRNDGYSKDFFTNNEYSDWYNNYKISLSYWKSNMRGRLLFDTNDKEAALNFYETYEQSKKYNL